MNVELRKDAEAIARRAIEAVSPDAAVRRALAGRHFPGRIYLVAVGKAAWKMAEAALSCLTAPVYKGIVITKYNHVMGPLPGISCREAGHPVPDENGFAATKEALEMTAHLEETDTVLFLLSGGGSALFEKPLIPGEELQEITRQMLSGGADIVEMNTIRKRLSAVKGGKFACHCAPAQVEAIVLSDILGDPLDMIASGPAAPDTSTCEKAAEIAVKYGLTLGAGARSCLERETPKTLRNVRTQVIGSVRELCRAAEAEAAQMGYECVFLSDCLNGEASDTGRWMAGELKKYAKCGRKIALLAGGETVVHVKGGGLGGRNQELAIAAAQEMAGMSGAALISVGSDGTDGPTDAAGGYVDGDTCRTLQERGMDLQAYLDNNDAYHALQAAGGLIITGPTGTNVNDVTIGLIRPEDI